MGSVFIGIMRKPWFGEVDAAKISLHPLEISSKSPEAIGKSLSAMNLRIGSVPVESFYQGSKVFENGGPYDELYKRDGFAAKRYKKLRTSGRLIGFRFLGNDYTLDPPTAFYDWLWICGFIASGYEVGDIAGYIGFTDKFHSKRSMACQARSAAILCGLSIRFPKTLLNSDGEIGSFKRFIIFYTKED